mgnify:FL=1
MIWFLIIEDQEHRFVASGIDVPTGMKNPTSGNLNVMFNGIYAAQNKQNFLFNGEEVETPGNALAHVILRGSTNEYGKNVPNFYYDDVLVLRRFQKTIANIRANVFTSLTHGSLISSYFGGNITGILIVHKILYWQ